MVVLAPDRTAATSRSRNGPGNADSIRGRFLAAAIASPALWAGFVTQQLDVETALVRLLIAIPVAAIMLGLVRAVTHDYGKSNEKRSRQDSADNPLRAEAIAGEAYPQRRTDDPTP